MIFISYASIVQQNILINNYKFQQIIYTEFSDLCTVKLILSYNKLYIILY
jgi:hypothetical protein